MLVRVVSVLAYAGVASVQSLPLRGHLLQLLQMLPRISIMFRITADSAVQYQTDQGCG